MVLDGLKNDNEWKNIAKYLYDKYKDIDKTITGPFFVYFVFSRNGEKFNLFAPNKTNDYHSNILNVYDDYKNISGKEVASIAI